MKSKNDSFVIVIDDLHSKPMTSTQRNDFLFKLIIPLKFEPRTFIIYIFLLFSMLGYSQGKTRIACVGNSITYGAAIENRETNSYPAQLSAMLGDGYEVRNFGVSGTTLLRKGDISYRETTEYQQSLKFQPNWVFIKLGTNDTKPVNRIYLNEYVQDYKDLITTFRQLPSSPRIVLLLPIPVFSADSTSITSSIVREKLLPMIRQVAYETGCEIIDLYSLLIESEGLVADKVHPSAEGAAVIARRIYELVRMKSEPTACFSKELVTDAQPFNFHGFEAYDFTFKNRNAKIVVPKHIAPGHPWIWRARFWGHEPQTDIALLERGFHVVYCDVSELYGNKEALSVWNDYYHFLTRKCRLSKKSVMEGMSRGGIYIYRWAAKYPERVAAVYADAPVLDLKSWPGGKGLGTGSAEDWEVFKKDFNLETEKDALSFRGNPIDLTTEIAGAGFPMIHVVGDADDIVPVEENTAPFEQKVKDQGGFITVIHKPGVGHHPHSLQNPQPIVDFILRATDYWVTQDRIPVPSGPQLRWQNYERIMFLHFAPNTWTGLEQDDLSLPLSRINPNKLNTDQWCKVAKNWGAKMIIFVSKHSGGFCWWQTTTTDYSVRNIPWKNGKGDVLADLSKSCKKYGLDLGVYIYPGDKNLGAGGGGRTKDPAMQQSYNKVFRQQLIEVLSKYQPMKEVWFDGSCAIDIRDILEKYASDAVIFQGEQATIRWVGNEIGIAPYPNWYTLRNSDLKTGNATALHSDPNGDAYAPVEVDEPFLTSSRMYKWFWAPNTDSLLFSVAGLMEIYNKSVGRGSVLNLNATPDTTGLIPDAHASLYSSFGKELSNRFDKPIASASGKGNVLDIDMHKSQIVNCAVIREAIVKGQRVRKFVLEGFSNGQWQTIKEGTSVGSKRIEEFAPIKISKVRLRILDAIATPFIENLALYNIDQSDKIGLNKPTENKAVTISGWDKQTFSTDWQNFSIDLTPYLIEKVGQFELKFQYITHDWEFEKLGFGGYGLEFDDWKIEIEDNSNPDVIKKSGECTFLISNSQHLSKETTSRIVFKTQIRTKPGRSAGSIDLRMIGLD